MTMLGSKYNYQFFVLSLIFLNLSSFKIINTMEPGTGSELAGVVPGLQDDSSSDSLGSAYAGSDKDWDDGLETPGGTNAATAFDRQSEALMAMAEENIGLRSEIDALRGFLREEEIAHAVRLQAEQRARLGLSLEAKKLREQLGFHSYNLVLLGKEINRLKRSGVYENLGGGRFLKRGMTGSRRGRGERHGTIRGSYRVFGSSRVEDSLRDD